MRVPRRGVRFAMGAGVACIVLAGAPAAASADLEIAYRRVGGTVSEGTQSAVSASCPAGMSVSGGGADAAGGYGGVGLNTTYPPSEAGWTSYYDSNGGTVLIHSYVVCVNRQPVIGTKSSFASGTGTTVARSRCKGSGRKPTGGGVFSLGAFGQTAILHTVPYALPNQRPGGEDFWQVILYNTSNPYVDHIDFTSYVVCHKSMKLHYREEQHIIKPGKRVTVISRCNPDERIVGGGGLAASLDIYVQESFPVDLKRDNDKLRDDAWAATLDNFDAQEEIAASFAVCAEV